VFHSFPLSLSFLRSLFVSLSKYGKETGDVDVFSMSGLTVGRCSTQLSCQQPNTTVNSTACAFDIATYSSFAFFLSSLTSLRRTGLLVAHHYNYLQPVDAAAGVFVASHFLPSASVRHTPPYKKEKELDLLLSFFFLSKARFSEQHTIER
jgi:hypothetical protein